MRALELHIFAAGGGISRREARRFASQHVNKVWIDLFSPSSVRRAVAAARNTPVGLVGFIPSSPPGEGEEGEKIDVVTLLREEGLAEGLSALAVDVDGAGRTLPPLLRSGAPIPDVYLVSLPGTGEPGGAGRVENSGNFKDNNELELDSPGNEMSLLEEREKSYEASVRILAEGGKKPGGILLYHPDIVTNHRLNGYLRERIDAPLILAVPLSGNDGSLPVETSLRLASMKEQSVSRLLLLPENPSTGYPHREKRRKILRGAEMCRRNAQVVGVLPREFTIISCPMCGRCTLDIPDLARRAGRTMDRIARRCRRRGTPLEGVGGLTIAVMGCSVNGPGEARGADIGIAGGRGKTGALFAQGKPVVTLPEGRLLKALRREVLRTVDARWRGR